MSLIIFIMSENKSLIQQLSHCEKYEFDEVVKSYLKEIYKLTNIVFTDGKTMVELM